MAGRAEQVALGRSRWAGFVVPFSCFCFFLVSPPPLLGCCLPPRTGGCASLLIYFMGCRVRAFVTHRAISTCTCWRGCLGPRVTRPSSGRLAAGLVSCAPRPCSAVQPAEPPSSFHLSRRPMPSRRGDCPGGGRRTTAALVLCFLCFLRHAGDERAATGLPIVNTLRASFRGRPPPPGDPAGSF